MNFPAEKVNELGAPATRLPQLPSQTQSWKHAVVQDPHEMLMGNVPKQKNALKMHYSA